ncbi:hypothetical protein OG900_38245 [Streptomyces sp. NBC_00433]
MPAPLRWALLFLLRCLRDFGYLMVCIPHPPRHPPAPPRPAAPGHPEQVTPLSALPPQERRRWKDLEKQLR